MSRELGAKGFVEELMRTLEESGDFRACIVRDAQRIERGWRLGVIWHGQWQHLAIPRMRAWIEESGAKA
jgi:hypothetical protein